MKRFELEPATEKFEEATSVAGDDEPNPLMEFYESLPDWAEEEGQSSSES